MLVCGTCPSRLVPYRNAPPPAVLVRTVVVLRLLCPCRIQFRIWQRTRLVNLEPNQMDKLFDRAPLVLNEARFHPATRVSIRIII